MPTTQGDKGETIKGKTPMHLHSTGHVSFFAENQASMFDKKGSINEPSRA